MKFYVTWGTGFSSIFPPPPSELIQLFNYTIKEFDCSGPLGYHGHVITYSYATLQDNEVVLPTPLMAQLVELLQTSGSSIEPTDLRHANKRLEVNQDVLDMTRGDDREVARAVAAHPKGQIEVRGFSATVAAIVLITRLFPRARCLILVPNKSLIRNLAYFLQGQLADEFGSRLKAHLQHGFPPMASANMVLLSTLATYRHWQQSHEDNVGTNRDHNWDVILVPDPLRSLGSVAVAALSRFSNLDCRVYSFVPRGTKFSPRERVLLTAISGPLVYRVPGTKVGTQTVWLNTPDTKPQPNDLPVEWKRHAYWGNRRRNEYVAAVARAFSTGDIRRLRKHGVPIQNNLPLIRGDGSPRVVVLVECSEHGRAMQELLPGWPLFTRYAQSPETTAAGTLGAIVTATRAERRGLTPDVLVVASGAPAQLGLERAWPTTDDFDDRDVLVVDFNDDSDRIMQEAAELRRKQCLQRGWSTAPWASAKLNHSIARAMT